LPRKKGSAQKAPANKRRTGRPVSFNLPAQNIFLEERARGATVKQAAKKAGVDAVTVFRHARADEEFKARKDQADELACDSLETIMEDLGRAGNIAALFGALKAMRPERWGAHVKHEFSGTIGLTGPDELLAARERARARAIAANGATLQ
jgi:hypothetical protein